MIKIVTGKINSNKTTRLRQYYEKHHEGDGFLAIKTMQGNIVHHYDLYQLKTGQTMPYVIRASFLKEDEDIRYQIGPYCFLEKAYVFLEKAIEEMINQKISPIYLDEISLLELEGKGLANILKRLLSLDIDLCLVVRRDLIDDVIHTFDIKTYEIIEEK